MGIPYTHGRWKVKAGREDDFIKAWERFAEVGLGKGATGVRLIQDLESPTDFFSFGSWNDADQIANFRGDPEFQGHIDGMQEMLESFETMRCETRLELGTMG